jgi:hypothetical protein
MASSSSNDMANAHGSAPEQFGETLIDALIGWQLQQPTHVRELSAVLVQIDNGAR